MSEIVCSNASDSGTSDILPVGWRAVSLAEVAEIRISNVDKKSAVGEIPVRLCNYIDVYKNAYITSALDFMEATATASEIARFSVEFGDVMITKDSETPDDIGVPAVAIWSDPKLVCGYHLALFKPYRNQIEPVFLAKQLRLPRITAYYGRLACGSTRYGLSNSGIARTPLRLPPLPEQRKIARILTTVDKLIEKTEALIAKYQAIKQGMMHDLFTRGVDEHGHLRPPYEEAPELYKPSELGRIPKAWEVRKLEQLYATPIRDFGSFSSTNLITFLEHGVPFIKSEMIEEGYVNWDSVTYISAEVHRRLDKSHVRKGNILFSKIGSALGKGVVYDGSRGICNSNAAVAKIDIDSRVAGRHFVTYFLNHGIAKVQLRNMIVSLLPRINLGDLSSLLVLTPALEEQQRIEGHFLAADTAIRSEKVTLDHLFEVKTGLMQDLLTGKVRVNVDTVSECGDD